MKQTAPLTHDQVTYCRDQTGMPLTGCWISKETGESLEQYIDQDGVVKYIPTRIQTLFPTREASYSPSEVTQPSAFVAEKTFSIPMWSVYVIGGLIAGKFIFGNKR